MVAEAVENYEVVLGILPAGSANGLSVDLNLPDTLEENLEIAFNSDYMEMDMISINGKKKPAPERYWDQCRIDQKIMKIAVFVASWDMLCRRSIRLQVSKPHLRLL